MPLPRHAIVLTAGLGTRLDPLTRARAKPAIPVAGIPMIRRIAGWLTANGVTDLVLNLHHLPDTLTAVVGGGEDLGATVRYSWEPVVLGSAGGPKQAAPILGAPRFFVVNGDTLTDVPLAELAESHARSGATVTLALVPNTEPLRYGGVLVDRDSRVSGFVPRGPRAEGSFHFIGVQIAEREAFESAPTAAPSQSIGGVYDKLLTQRPGAIGAFVSKASFWDVGTMADYVRMSRAFAASSAVDVSRGAGGKIAATARVTRSILWDDVHVEDGCTLDECIVTDGVRIPAGASYNRVALVRPRGSRDLDELLIAPITE